MVTLSWWHSTNHTPSVSPYGLPAPPPGSRGPCCPRWGKCRDSGKGGVVGNFGLVPFIGRHPLSLALLDSSPTGEPRFPCCPRWGKCRVSGKGGVVGNFGLSPFIEQHPLSLAPLDSSPIGEPRRALPGGERPWGYASGVRWMRMVGVLVSVKSRVKVASSFSVV